MINTDCVEIFEIEDQGWDQVSDQVSDQVEWNVWNQAWFKVFR